MAPLKTTKWDPGISPAPEKMPPLPPRVVDSSHFQNPSETTAAIYRLPPSFELHSEEVARFKASSVWACFSSAEDNDKEWTHFHFDTASGDCSLRGSLQSFDVKPSAMYTTPAGEKQRSKFRLRVKRMGVLSQSEYKLGDNINCSRSSSSPYSQTDFGGSVYFPTPRYQHSAPLTCVRSECIDANRMRGYFNVSMV